LPDVGTVAVDLIVEGVIDGHFIVAVVVDGVRKQLEPDSVTCSVIAS
jgi:hypothetical protein